MFEIFEDRFEIEVLKIRSLKLKFEIFLWDLKFRNYGFSKFKTRLNLEIEIWKFEIDRLNFEIMNFVNLKLEIENCET